MKGHLRKPLSSRSLLVFAFNLIFLKNIIKSKERAPMPKVFWQDQNTSVFPLKLCEKSDFSDGFWLLPLTTSTHWLLLPARGVHIQKAPA